MDPAVEALKRLVGGIDNPTRRQEVADAIGSSEQNLYQIVKGIALKSGKPRGVGRALRERLDAAFPSWMDTPRGQPVASMPAVSIQRALPVVLGRLAALGEYRAGQVLQALQAATKPGAPLEQIERDLLLWLTESPASRAPSGKQRGAA